MKNSTQQPPLNGNGLFQLIRAENSIGLKWVDHIKYRPSYNRPNISSAQSELLVLVHVCRPSSSSTICFKLQLTSYTTGQIWTKLHRNVPWEILYKKDKTKLIRQKHGCQGTLKETFKIFSEVADQN